MLFVQQGDGRSQVQLAAECGVRAVHAIECFTVAHENAQIAFAGRGWNLHRNLADNAFAAIRSQDGFHDDLVAGTRLGHIGAGAFQTRPAAFTDEVEIELHAVHCGSVVGVVVDASETLS